MKTEDIIIYGVGGFLLLNLLTKNKFGETLGQAAGEGTTNVFSGAVEGGIKGLLVNPYNWARNYDEYIPIIDDAAKAAVWLKQLGNDDAWFY